MRTELSFPDDIPIIGTIVVDGRTINIRSHHGTWEAAQAAYIQRSIRSILATRPLPPSTNATTNPASTQQAILKECVLSA